MIPKKNTLKYKHLLVCAIIFVSVAGAVLSALKGDGLFCVAFVTSALSALLELTNPQPPS